MDQERNLETCGSRARSAGPETNAQCFSEACARITAASMAFLKATAPIRPVATTIFSSSPMVTLSPSGLSNVDQISTGASRLTVRLRQGIPRNVLLWMIPAGPIRRHCRKLVARNTPHATTKGHPKKSQRGKPIPWNRTSPATLAKGSQREKIVVPVSGLIVSLMLACPDTFTDSTTSVARCAHDGQRNNDCTNRGCRPAESRVASPYFAISSGDSCSKRVAQFRTSSGSSFPSSLIAFEKARPPGLSFERALVRTSFRPVAAVSRPPMCGIFRSSHLRELSWPDPRQA